MLALYGVNLGRVVNLPSGGGGSPKFSTTPVFTPFQADPRNAFQTAPTPPKGTLVVPPLSPTPRPPMPPVTPSAPSLPPVIITTSPPPPVPLDPPQEVPGAGPHIVPDPSGAGASSADWYNLFDPNAFAWWKPVILAVGIAAFGGAIIAALRHKH